MRSAATSLAVLAALAPSVASATPTKERSPSSPSDLVPRIAFHAGGVLDPSVGLVLRGAAGRDDSLVGPTLRAYRAAPELFFGLRPAPRVEIFAGGGAGPAYLVPEQGAPVLYPESTAIAISASLGARFPWQGVPVTALARAESVCGHGSAVMLRLALDLAAR